MDRWCPRCSKLTTDDRLVRCPFCGSLFNDPSKDPFPLTEQQERKIYAHLQSKLKLYVFGGFSIFAVISGVFLVDSLISVYTRAADFLNRTMLERVTEQFKDPAIRKVVTDVASTEAKQLLAEQIAPEVNRFQGETRASIDSFRRFTSNMETRYTRDYSRLSLGVASLERNEQRVGASVSKLEASNKSAEGLLHDLSSAVDDLARRKAVTDLSNVAISQASRPALSALLKTAESDESPQIRELASAEVMRVKAFWIGVSRTTGVDLMKDGKQIHPSELKTCEIIAEVLHNPQGAIRAVLTGELGRRKNEPVPETLLQVIDYDPDLEVVKDAIQAWAILTGYRSPDVFGVIQVQTWWQSNKDNLTKSLGKAESCS